MLKIYQIIWLILDYLTDFYYKIASSVFIILYKSNFTLLKLKIQIINIYLLLSIFI